MKPRIKWWIRVFGPCFLTRRICAFVQLGYSPGNPEERDVTSLSFWLQTNFLTRPSEKAAVPVCNRLHCAHTVPLCSAGRRHRWCQWNGTFERRSSWTVLLRCRGPSRCDHQGSGSCSQQNNYWVHDHKHRVSHTQNAGCGSDPLTIRSYLKLLSGEGWLVAQQDSVTRERTW